MNQIIKELTVEIKWPIVKKALKFDYKTDILRKCNWVCYVKVGWKN
jgi:hypothetical protein